MLECGATVASVALDVYIMHLIYMLMQPLFEEASYEAGNVSGWDRYVHIYTVCYIYTPLYVAQSVIVGV